LLGKANNGIDTAGDFLASELPEVIQQLLMWHMTVNIIWSFVFLCVFATVGWLFWFCCKKEDKSGGWGPGIFLCVIGLVVTFLGFFSYASTALQIWIAPKVWLIEYAAKLAS
jgi:hypothetical protein